MLSFATNARGLHSGAMLIVRSQLFEFPYSYRISYGFLVFLPLCRLILIRMFPDFDSEAKRSGLLILPADYNFQNEGKTVLLNRDRVGLSIASTRTGYEMIPIL
jgi:hypothetical protein